MPDQTPNLALPWLMPAQAQKHVTVNEALGRLDALVQTSVDSRTVIAEPANPSEGEAWLIPAGATGASWAGFAEHTLAYFQDGAWHTISPRAGQMAHIRDEGEIVVFDGSGWVSLSTLITALSNLERLGVGTTPDATNPFAAKLNNTLWTALSVAEGGSGDVRFTLNKEAPGDTASFIFQSGWSGRAEFGLTGTDNFALKLSDDGTNFSEILNLSPAGFTTVKTNVMTVTNIGDNKTRLKLENDRNDAFGQVQFQVVSDTSSLYFQAHGSGLGAFRWGQALAGWSELISMSGGGFAIGTLGNAPVILGTNSQRAMRITGDGKVGVFTDNPSCDFDIDSNRIRLRQSLTPASASATGETGEVCWDGDYVYVCVATDTWKRAALSTW